jgi:hypothetical protein
MTGDRPAGDREQWLDLLHRHLEGTLTGEEREELESILQHSEEARRELLLAAALHQELFILHEVPGREPSVGAALEKDALGDASVRRASTLRGSRRFVSDPSPASWAPAFVAASLLVGLALFALMFSSGGPSKGAGRPETARSREGQAPSQPPGILPKPTPAAGDSERVHAEEERIRADAARRLAELERRRHEVEKTVPPGTPEGEKLDRKKTDLGLLDEERRRIEEEMKSAIEKARQSARPPSPVVAPGERSLTVAEKESPEKPVPLASIERAEGEAFLVRKDGRSPLREGASLFAGDGLETPGPKGRVMVRFTDGTRLDLRGESLVSEIADASPPGGSPGKQVVLARGSVSAEVAKQPANRPMLFRTPHSEATVLGTSLRLQVDPGEKGATKLEVLEGRVRFARLIDRKGVVEVTGGHQSVAALGVPLASRPFPVLPSGTSQRPAVATVTLVNADTGRPFLQYDPLEDGTVLTLADLPTRNLNILATTSPAAVGCVVFSWDGTPVIEGRAPYFLGGNDQRGKPVAWTPMPGDHVLVVTPYSGPSAANRREGTGTAGAGVTIRLRVR